MPSDETLYLYTSLTAGSSHIITATSRIETILKANKIPFKAVDCATDEKARMLWARRSKGKKIPGLVKFNDVIADLEQVEEWNEYGELEDEIDGVMDIFGDVPISATSAEAQAAAAQRASQAVSSSSAARTASETRHISISEPVNDKKAKDAKKEKDDNPATSLGGPSAKDTPMSAAMRQAGAEAAAKAGQKKTSAAEAIKAQARKSGDATAKTIPAPTVPTGAAAMSKLDPAVAEPGTANTVAKTPILLAAEGATKTTSTDKMDADLSNEDSSDMSNEEQVLEQRKKSSVPQTRSSLAKVTSVQDSHTVSTSGNSRPKSTSTPAAPGSKSKSPASQKTATSKPNSVPAKMTGVSGPRRDDDYSEEEEDDDDDEDEDGQDEKDNDDDDDEEEEEEESEEEKKPVKTPAAKVGATDKQEGKVLKGELPQKQGAKDGKKTGVSVGD